MWLMCFLSVHIFSSFFFKPINTYFIQLNIICDMKNISVIHTLYVQQFPSIDHNTCLFLCTTYFIRITILFYT